MEQNIKALYDKILALSKELNELPEREFELMTPWGLFGFIKNTDAHFQIPINQETMERVRIEMLRDLQEVVGTLKSPTTPLKSLLTHVKPSKANMTPSQAKALYGEDFIQKLSKRFFVDIKRDRFIKR